MTGAHVQLELSIDVGSEPIAGSLSVAGGPRRGFSGWMDLVAAIESIRERGAAEDAALTPAEVTVEVPDPALDRFAGEHH